MEKTPYQKLGFDHRHEILLYLPRDYVDYTNFVRGADLSHNEGEVVCFRGRLVVAPQFIKADKSKVGANGRPPMDRIEYTISDGSGRIRITEFGRLWPGHHLADVKLGDEFIVRGKVKSYMGNIQMTMPEQIPAPYAGKVIPRYSPKSGVLSEEKIFAEMQEVLKDAKLVENAATYLRQNFGGEDAVVLDDAGAPFTKLKALLEAIHAPYSIEEARAALESAKSISICHLIWVAQQQSLRRPCLPSILNMDRSKELLSMIPYELTGDQARSVNEILRDLASPFPMNRLLSGDVGSGKTLTYAIPAAAAHLAGHAVALMIPNEVLMTQVRKDIQKWFPEVKFCTVVGGNDKERFTEDNPFYIGTTALIPFLEKERVPLDLIVIDEQQKMSRDQRERLALRHTNILEATATCLPRTAALVEHGTMNLSSINELPVVKDIHTEIIEKKDWQRIVDEISAAVAAGDQAMIIYPKVASENEEDSMKSVDKAFERWNAMFPGNVRMLHGKLKGDQKVQIIEDMKAGKFQILIATSLVEIGVEIPDLRVEAIVHPEVFGASTLHQMRGRVARKGGSGKFFMYVQEEITDESRERLKLLVKYSRGIDIANGDLEIRGFGDIRAEANEQSGGSKSLLFANVKIFPRDVKALFGEEVVSIPKTKKKAAPKGPKP